MQELEKADVGELVIHRRLSRVEMRRSFGCEGISEDGILSGTRDGDWICRQRCSEVGS